MSSLNFARLVWYVRRYSALIGAAGVVGIILFAVTGVVGWGALKTTQKQLQAEKAAVEALQSPAQLRQVPLRTSAEQLDAFYRTFPVRAAIPDAMEKLYAAAEGQHIELEHGEYQLIKIKGDHLSRYEIVLPVKGGYTAIRKFVTQSMSEIPTLALNSIAFSRQRIDDPLVDAELKFTLFLGDK